MTENNTTSVDEVVDEPDGDAETSVTAPAEPLAADGTDSPAAAGDSTGDVPGGPAGEVDAETPADAAGGRSSKVDRLEAEGDIAADYLEELLDIADLDGDLDIDVDGDRAAVSVVGADLQQLVGPHGEVLDALQELTRLVVYRETGERSRLMLDISGYRAERRAELEQLAAVTIAEVQASGEKVALAAMSPFERKVVHDAVAGAGLQSESEGTEPRRYVVILPA